MRTPIGYKVSLFLVLLALGCRPVREPILIGLAGPFSQTRGASMQLAAELAVAEINQQGGIGGQELALVTRDDSASADVAIGVARELVETPGLVAVIGHLNSSATIAAAPVYNGADHPVVEISPSASSPALSTAGPYTFRVCPDDLVHGTRLAQWARERVRTRSVAVIYQNDDYGRGVRKTFTQSFTALGGLVLEDDPYVPGLPTFEPYLQRARRRGALDAVMIAGTQTGGERILATLDSLGIRPTVLGGDGLTGIEMSDAVDPTGVFISSAYLPDRPGARNQAFVKAYRAAYGNQLPDHRGAGTYDIVYLLAQAIEAVGPDRRRIRDYLAGVGAATPAFEGVTGTIAFNADGDVPDKDVLIGVVRERRLVTAPGQ